MMHNASSNKTGMPDFMEECTAMQSWGCHMINSTEEQKATWLCLVYFSLRLVIFFSNPSFWESIFREDALICLCGAPLFFESKARCLENYDRHNRRVLAMQLTCFFGLPLVSPPDRTWTNSDFFLCLSTISGMFNHGEQMKSNKSTMIIGS